MGNAATFAGLGLVKATLNRLARLPSVVSPDVAQAINDKLADQAVDGTDAYSRSHAPLAPSTLAKGRTPPPLWDTGESWAATRARPLSGAGIGITLGGHLSRHMRPGKGRPARPVLPRGALPPAWRLAIQAAIERRAGMKASA